MIVNTSESDFYDNILLFLSKVESSVLIYEFTCRIMFSKIVATAKNYKKELMTVFDCQPP